MLVHVAMGFFIVCAIALYWLGRQQRREVFTRRGTIEVGMSEAEVLASFGPPDEIRRNGDPLAAGFFADHRRESYLYRDHLEIQFERGHVTRVISLDSKSPMPPPKIIANRPPAPTPIPTTPLPAPPIPTPPMAPGQGDPDAPYMPRLSEPPPPIPTKVE